jgi:hypothetical protein
MSEYIAYLNKEIEQTIEDDRIRHMLLSLNIQLNEVRFKELHLDFTLEETEGRKLPYATIDGKPKSYENLWKDIIGDKVQDEI